MHRILIADNEFSSRTRIKYSILEENKQIIFADNGVEAAEKAYDMNVDLVIMRCSRTGDDINSLNIIRMSEPDLPIIVYVRGDDPVLAEETFRNGANITFEEPFGLEEFRKAVNILLGIKTEHPVGV